MQVYSNPERETDEYALPDIEVFFMSSAEALKVFSEMPLDQLPEDSRDLRGWYWQACFPGCLPDGEPMGPYATRAEAIADAQAE